MLQRLRLILLVALLVALPLRAYAAAAMLFCAGSHGSAAVAAGVDHDHHATAAGHAGTHGDDAPGAMHAMAGNPSGTEDGNHAPVGNHDGQHSCSICGACCTGVATGPALPCIAAATPASTPIPFAPPHYAGVDLLRDERPPLA